MLVRQKPCWHNRERKIAAICLFFALMCRLFLFILINYRLYTLYSVQIVVIALQWFWTYSCCEMSWWQLTCSTHVADTIMVLCCQKPQAGSSEDTMDSSLASSGHDPDVYKEQFGTRFIVRCDDFKLRLQANIGDDGHPERLDNVCYCFFLYISN